MPKLDRNGRHRVGFTLNGKPVSGHAEPRMLLSDFLAGELGLTSVHVGCEHGVCGACTVRIDGRVARACLALAVQAEGRRIDTAESLASAEGELNALQTAFRRHHGLQCGFCTAGIVMTFEAYLKENPRPSEEAVREVLSGNLCRCTGYQNIVAAILRVAQAASDGKA